MSRIRPHGSVKRSFAATLNNPDSAYVAKLPETELQTATRALLAGTIMSEFHLKISKKKSAYKTRVRRPPHTFRATHDARPTESERRGGTDHSTHGGEGQVCMHKNVYTHIVNYAHTQIFRTVEALAKD